MRTYIIKRLLLIPPTLLGISIISFAIMRMAPGRPTPVRSGAAGGIALERNALNRQAAEQWYKERHLDKPLWVQYLYWVRDLATLRVRTFGQPPEPVTRRILQALPYTVALNVVSFFFIYAIAIPIGIICAVRQNTLLDRALTLIVFLLYSLPSFWVGLLMLIFLCEPKYFEALGLRGEWAFPATGLYDRTLAEVGFGQWLWGWIRHWTLPVACLTYGGFAFLSRQMRGALLEQIRQDYIRTARAKGLPERVVILKHAVRNSLIPIITLFGTLLPAMITGSVIIESIFSIHGMGRLLITAITERDYPTVMTLTTLAAVLTMIGILISDLLYAVVDPRITLDRPAA